jgi:hypothetical protein
MDKDFLTKVFWGFWIGLMVLQVYSKLAGY